MKQIIGFKNEIFEKVLEDYGEYIFNPDRYIFRPGTTNSYIVVDEDGLHPHGDYYELLISIDDKPHNLLYLNVSASMAYIVYDIEGITVDDIDIEDIMMSFYKKNRILEIYYHDVNEPSIIDFIDLHDLDDEI